MKITAMGDSAIKIEFDGEVTPTLNKKIQLFCLKLEKAAIHGVIEWVPAFNSIAIYYDPTKILFKELMKELEWISLKPLEQKVVTQRLLHVPVLYGGEVGSDLERVARYNEISSEMVITLHQEPDYLVYMMGFLPGFPYLGGLPTKLATPRLEEPRSNTFAGAVGIAHEQTGIYPLASPGGWNIIGRTPIRLFNPNYEQDAFQFKAGDLIRFYQITEKEYDNIVKQMGNGTFKVKQEQKK
ncbi:5-oxoprolinase subunit PxpB [Ornithinibacillus salinisoli]|uniref:5-oxoprolinase subunit PxpB n=1 Tax=Ornithinibacillus salinisoli TaxID=1848459 RepID=A0ABW4W0R1_9BACI